jgi:prophage DNA circulation protein
MLATSTKMPAVRICDKCLFKETEKLFSQDANLGTAIERLDKEQRNMRAAITGAIEARVQLLNSTALALDSQLGGLREQKKQLQETLAQVTGHNGETVASTGTSSHKDLRASAVKRLVDERMTPASNRSTDGGSPIAAAPSGR